MMKVVLFFINPFSASRISASVSVSTDEVESSRIRMPVGNHDQGRGSGGQSNKPRVDFSPSLDSIDSKYPQSPVGNHDGSTWDTETGMLYSTNFSPKFYRIMLPSSLTFPLMYFNHFCRSYSLLFLRRRCTCRWRHYRRTWLRICS